MADKFLNFLDLFDGGGRGASGAEFEGGGLLSGLGNALFKPAGYADREEERLAGIRPQSRPQRGVSPAQVTVPTAPEAPYFPEMPVGGAMPPMAVAPAAYNQTLNFEPSEQDSIRGRLNQLYGGNYISDGLGASDANIAFNKGPYSSGVGGGVSPVQMGMNQDPEFQNFLSQVRQDPEYRPEYENIDMIYDVFKQTMGR
jgi:hypothetical protein